MTAAGALTRARALREALLDHGVPKVSIEIQTGRPGTPNSRWYDTRFIGSCGHHIVSRRSQGLTPGLALIKRGRSDVPGPLCNGYGGFDLTARIICMGWANHPGAGGPHTLPGGTIPRDGARPYLFGWEFEGGIVLADWTDEMRSFMGSCHAGTLDWLGRDEKSHVEHFTWAPRRKIDRLKYTLSAARAEVRANWDEPEDDHMSAADVAELKKYIDAKIPDVARAVHERSVLVGSSGPDGPAEPLGQAVGRALSTVRRIELGQLGVDDLVPELAAQLAPLLGGGGSPSQDDLEAALRAVLGSLDE